MSLPVVLSAEADTDFEEAFDFYEQQQVGLGDRFEEAVRAAKSKIAENPMSFAKVWREVRCVRVKKFKYYVLYYLIETDRIVVISVFHSRRDPRIWQRRVK